MRSLISILLFLVLSISVCAQHIEPKQKKGLYGFAYENTMIIDFRYDSIIDNKDGSYYVRNDGKWGMVNPMGQEVIPCTYDKLTGWWPNLKVGTLNGYMGILDSNGMVVLDFIYDKIDHMADGEALVKLKGQWCLLAQGKYNYNEDDLIFHRPDTFPLFAACQDNGEPYEKMKDCATQQMYNFIFNNIHYPAEARKKGIQGQVILRFEVSREGVIQNPEVIRGIGGGCDEEAIAMMNKMPPWIPARFEGRNVAAQFHMPVRFILR